MDQPGNQLFARAALPLQYHRRISLRQSLDPIHHLPHDGAGTDNSPLLLATIAGAMSPPPQAGDAKRMPQHGEQTIILYRQAVIVETVVQEQLLHPGQGQQMRGSECDPDHGAACLTKQDLHRLGGIFAQQHQTDSGRLLCVVAESFLRR
ncbi:hypothetical protein D3C86_1064220 [compost metagenome]